MLITLLYRMNGIKTYQNPKLKIVRNDRRFTTSIISMIDLILNNKQQTSLNKFKLKI